LYLFSIEALVPQDCAAHPSGAAVFDHTTLRTNAEIVGHRVLLLLDAFAVAYASAGGHWRLAWDGRATLFT
jgi:hypothetical protein